MISEPYPYLEAFERIPFELAPDVDGPHDRIFEVTPEQEERAAKLHRESIVFDLHDHVHRLPAGGVQGPDRMNVLDEMPCGRMVDRMNGHRLRAVIDGYIHRPLQGHFNPQRSSAPAGEKIYYQPHHPPAFGKATFSSRVNRSNLLSAYLA